MLAIFKNVFPLFLLADVYDHQKSQAGSEHQYPDFAGQRHRQLRGGNGSIAQFKSASSTLGFTKKEVAKLFVERFLSNLRK